MKTHSSKIVLLGPTNVGKSSLVHRIFRDRFLESGYTTIGAAFVCTELKVDDGRVLLNFWDTAGQERFSHFLPTYIRDANIALLCFETFDERKVKSYMNACYSENEDMIVVLVTTKWDIKEETCKLSNNFAILYDLPIFHTSSKTRYGIDELVEWLKETTLDIHVPPQKGSVTLSLSSEKKCCFVQ